jgi:hypothetical protein
MIVKTGYGFFTNKNGDVISKYNLPIGEHPLNDDVIYVEVESLEELDKIEIYVSEDEQLEKKIEAEVAKIKKGIDETYRATAIQNLVDSGAIKVEEAEKAQASVDCNIVE